MQEFLKMSFMHVVRTFILGHILLDVEFSPGSPFHKGTLKVFLSLMTSVISQSLLLQIIFQSLVSTLEGKLCLCSGCL